VNPFEPKGPVAKWELIYEHLADLGVGQTVTYEDLSSWVGHDIRENRSPYYQAVKKLREKEHRTLVNVQGVGYKVVDATQHGEIARHHTQKANRQVTKARHVLSNTDYNDLPPEIAQRFQAQEQKLGNLQTLTRSLARRQDKLESTLKAVRRESKENVAELNERLARLERMVQPEAKSA
jgi:DNA anti-recombination protein RmuC